jgi:hypothetical protein
MFYPLNLDSRVRLSGRKRGAIGSPHETEFYVRWRCAFDRHSREIRRCLIYAFAAPGERLRPASVAGLTRGLTGDSGFMRQRLAILSHVGPVA